MSSVSKVAARLIRVAALASLEKVLSQREASNREVSHRAMMQAGVVLERWLALASAGLSLKAWPGKWRTTHHRPRWSKCKPGRAHSPRFQEGVAGVGLRGQGSHGSAVGPPEDVCHSLLCCQEPLEKLRSGYLVGVSGLFLGWAGSGKWKESQALQCSRVKKDTIRTSPGICPVGILLSLLSSIPLVT